MPNSPTRVSFRLPQHFGRGRKKHFESSSTPHLHQPFRFDSCRICSRQGRLQTISETDPSCKNKAVTRLWGRADHWGICTIYKVRLIGRCHIQRSMGVWTQ